MTPKDGFKSVSQVLNKGPLQIQEDVMNEEGHVWKKVNTKAKPFLKKPMFLGTGLQKAPKSKQHVFGPTCIVAPANEGHYNQETHRK